jgi:hypothetical protein
MAGGTKSRAGAAKGGRSASLFRPGLLTAAFALFWAAFNQPNDFTVISTIVWLLEAGTVALLFQAGFVCLTPAVRLLVIWLRNVLPRGDTP